LRDFILDTQTIRYWYDPQCLQHDAVVGNINALRKRTASSADVPKLVVSVVTLGEIEFGHRVARVPLPDAQEAYTSFVRKQLPFRLEVSEDAAAAYGELRKLLFDKYAPGEKRKPKMRPEQLIDPVQAIALQIQENDLWLCAQAIAHGMVLVTNDRMQAIQNVAAGMIPPLVTENWTLPEAVRG
jgi:predicted nucleic acid-binding protein